MGESKVIDADQLRTLRKVFLLNAGLSIALFAAGIAASSATLIANGADNASDAAVYALSYFAASHGARWKVRAARMSGVALLILAVAVLLESARRFFGDSEPVGLVIIVMSVLAASVNLLCLKLLRAHKKDDVNFRAAWIFSINDMLSNLGALAAGVLVLWLARPWPDLVVGIAIALVAAKGGWEILEDAKENDPKEDRAS